MNPVVTFLLYLWLPTLTRCLLFKCSKHEKEPAQSFTRDILCYLPWTAAEGCKQFKFSGITSDFVITDWIEVNSTSTYLGVATVVLSAILMVTSRLVLLTEEEDEDEPTEPSTSSADDAERNGRQRRNTSQTSQTKTMKVRVPSRRVKLRDLKSSTQSQSHSRAHSFDSGQVNHIISQLKDDMVATSKVHGKFKKTASSSSSTAQRQKSPSIIYDLKRPDNIPSEVLNTLVCAHRPFCGHDHNAVNVVGDKVYVKRSPLYTERKKDKDLHEPSSSASIEFRQSRKARVLKQRNENSPLQECEIIPVCNENDLFINCNGTGGKPVKEQSPEPSPGPSSVETGSPAVTVHKLSPIQSTQDVSESADTDAVKYNLEQIENIPPDVLDMIFCLDAPTCSHDHSRLKIIGDELFVRPTHVGMSSNDGDDVTRQVDAHNRSQVFDLRERIPDALLETLKCEDRLRCNHNHRNVVVFRNFVYVKGGYQLNSSINSGEKTLSSYSPNDPVVIGPCSLDCDSLVGLKNQPLSVNQMSQTDALIQADVYDLRDTKKIPQSVLDMLTCTEPGCTKHDHAGIAVLKNTVYVSPSILHEKETITAVQQQDNGSATRSSPDSAKTPKTEHIHTKEAATVTERTRKVHTAKRKQCEKPSKKENDMDSSERNDSSDCVSHVLDNVRKRKLQKGKREKSEKTAKHEKETDPRDTDSDTTEAPGTSQQREPVCWAETYIPPAGKANRWSDESDSETFADWHAPIHDGCAYCSAGQTCRMAAGDYPTVDTETNDTVLHTEIGPPRAASSFTEESSAARTAIEHDYDAQPKNQATVIPEKKHGLSTSEDDTFGGYLNYIKSFNEHERVVTESRRSTHDSTNYGELSIQSSDEFNISTNTEDMSSVSVLDMSLSDLNRSLTFYGDVSLLELAASWFAKKIIERIVQQVTTKYSYLF